MSSSDAEAFCVQHLRACTFLGGSGFPFVPGEKLDLFFDGHGATVRGESRSASFSYLELADLSITGPGAVTTGGGFIGGGFGVEGALEGMAVATVLNALSTKTRINTFITVVANFGEIHLHYDRMEPSALRIAFSGVFVKLRRVSLGWLDARKQILEAHKIYGSISAEECEALQNRLFSQPTWPDPEAEAKLRLAEKAAIGKLTVENGPKGTCPSCDKLVGLYVDVCPHCTAQFGPGSAWNVIPVVERDRPVQGHGP